MLSRGFRMGRPWCVPVWKPAVPFAGGGWGYGIHRRSDKHGVTIDERYQAATLPPNTLPRDRQKNGRPYPAEIRDTPITEQELAPSKLRRDDPRPVPAGCGAVLFDGLRACCQHRRGRKCHGAIGAAQFRAALFGAAQFGAAQSGFGSALEKPPLRNRMRRSFSQTNSHSDSQVRGEGALAQVLGEALSTPAQGGYRLTHRFHAYPGRCHPHLPQAVLGAMARPGDSVLDPFMGGGTVLVEALLLGLKATGNDLNPIAGLVGRERTRPRTPADAAIMNAEAERIAGLVEGLRREKRPPRVNRPRLPRLKPLYQPHLLAELVQWIRLIDSMRPGEVRETLRAVFSALAVKFSVRRSGSNPELHPVNYPKGAVTRFFMEKCRELTQAQVELGRLLPQPWPPCEILSEDARLLPSLGWSCVDHVVTSPPYPGLSDTYDHHRICMDWLDLDGEPFRAGEIGARRQGEASGWSAALGDVLGSLARVLKPAGNLILVIGDWADGGTPSKAASAAGASSRRRSSRPHAVDGAGMAIRIAAGKGWRCLSRASALRQAHNKWEKQAFARRGKWEHVLHFRRDAGATTSRS